MIFGYCYKDNKIKNIKLLLKDILQVIVLYEIDNFLSINFIVGYVFYVISFVQNVNVNGYVYFNNKYLI